MCSCVKGSIVRSQLVTPQDFSKPMPTSVMMTSAAVAVVLDATSWWAMDTTDEPQLTGSPLADRAM